MKAAMVLLLLCSGWRAAEAQSNTITLGEAVLKLGMSEAEVKAEIAKHPPLTEEENGTIANMPAKGLGKDDYARYSLYGSVDFTHGRLSRVEKFWKPSHSAETDVILASALYGAVSAAVGTIPRLCCVSTRSEAEPDQDYRETTIDCSSPGISRSIHVFIKTLHGSQQDFYDAQVSEVLEAR